MEYNYRGDILTENNRYILEKEEYAGDDGLPDWENNLQFADKNGFDKRAILSNGKYIEKIILPPGKRIVRYGVSSGSFTTDERTDYCFLSMPYKIESLPYHEYIVKEACEVLCLVDKGRVAPGFDRPGGAIQYHHYRNIKKEVKSGVLEEDLSWLHRIQK